MPRWMKVALIVVAVVVVVVLVLTRGAEHLGGSGGQGQGADTGATRLTQVEVRRA